MALAVARAVHRRAHPVGPSRVRAVAGREVALQVVTGRAQLEIRQAVGVATLRLAEVVDELFVEGCTLALPVRQNIFLEIPPSTRRGFRARSPNVKSSPLSRGIHTAACFAVQPRDWSDINGSGRGIAGAVG